MKKSLGRAFSFIEKAYAQLDKIILVADARVPYSSINWKFFRKFKSKLFIFFNKADLVPIAKVSNFVTNNLKLNPNYFIISNTKNLNKKKFLDKLTLNSKKKRFILKTAIIGLPNVGKSSLIKALSGGKKNIKIGNIPGITRSISWINLGKLFCIDTPGILEPNIDSKIRLYKLIMTKIFPADSDRLINATFWFVEKVLSKNPEEFFESLNFKQKDSKIDYIRAANFIVKQFSNGKFGKIFLEEYED